MQVAEHGDTEALARDEAERRPDEEHADFGHRGARAAYEQACHDAYSDARPQIVRTVERKERQDRPRAEKPEDEKSDLEYSVAEEELDDSDADQCAVEERGKPRGESDPMYADGA